MALNTNGKCEHCDGRVRNGQGRRRSIPELTDLHNHTCPGLNRGRTPRRKDNE